MSGLQDLTFPRFDSSVSRGAMLAPLLHNFTIAITARAYAIRPYKNI
jgi:hypothetical protein